MNHAVVTGVFDRNAGRHQFSRVGIPFVAHRVKLGGMDNGGWKSGEVIRAERRDSGIGGVRARRQVVGEIRLQGGPVDQMVFGERLA